MPPQPVSRERGSTRTRPSPSATAGAQPARRAARQPPTTGKPALGGAGAARPRNLARSKSDRTINSRPSRRVPPAAAPPTNVRTPAQQQAVRRRQLARSRSSNSVNRRRTPPPTAPTKRPGGEVIKPMALPASGLEPANKRGLGLLFRKAPAQPNAGASPAGARVSPLGGLFGKKGRGAAALGVPIIQPVAASPAFAAAKPGVRFADQAGSGAQAAAKVAPYAPSRGGASRSGNRALMARAAGQAGAQRARGASGAASRDLVLYRGGAGGARGVGGVGMGNAMVPGYNARGYTNSGMRMARTVRYGARGPNGSMVRSMAMAGGTGLMPVFGKGNGNGLGNGTSMTGVNKVVLDGESICMADELGGFEPIKKAIQYYDAQSAMGNDVDFFVVACEETLELWEDDEEQTALVIQRLKAAKLLFAAPPGSDVDRFMVKIAFVLNAHIVTNNMYGIMRACNQEPFGAMLYKKLIPFMVIRDIFIPHPDECNILEGLHAPRPEPPTPIGDMNGDMGMMGASPGMGHMGPSRGLAMGRPNVDSRGALRAARYRSTGRITSGARYGSGGMPRYNAGAVARTAAARRAAAARAAGVNRLPGYAQ